MSDTGQPVGPALRAAVAGQAALRAGGRMLAHGVRRPFLTPAARSEDEAAARQKAASDLYAAAAQLRGTALKIAQLLHWETGLVGGGAAETLSQACYQAPPMNTALVVDAFMRQFGRPPWQVFDHFTLSPFAAASLGQVHAATLSGESLCVKVRYPGIAASIETDLAALGVVARGLPQRRLLQRLLAEIAMRLREECDYRLEQQRTQWFRTTMALDGVEVPDTRPSLCGASLLTLTRVRGAHLRDWLATNPSQAARDAAAQRLHDIFTTGLFTLHRIHADPNPGNYLFRDDGTVGLIDFGCVKDVTAAFADQVAAIVAAHVQGDHERAFELTLAFGLFGSLSADEARGLDRELLQPFVGWLVRPFHTADFDFGANAGFAEECGRRFLAVVRRAESGAIYPDLLFVNRTLYGLYRVFEILGARVNVRHGWVSE